ncbi:hypothetical protein PRABACTJOHN_02628, partial [Parabacteroides johnsonii DSM 18315]
CQSATRRATSITLCRFQPAAVVVTAVFVVSACAGRLFTKQVQAQSERPVQMYLIVVFMIFVLFLFNSAPKIGKIRLRI